MLRRTSVATIGLAIGSILSVLGMAGYIRSETTLNVVTFFIGVPVLVGALALKAAELEPVPLKSEPSAEILALRESQATPTQNQVREDVTRYRYGQTVHLDIALERLGLKPSFVDECPILVGLRETTTDGAYTLVLEFETPHVPFEDWKKKEDRFAAFFGPGIAALVEQPDKDRVDISLIAKP
ncbi:MAG: DUF2854 domain-containing protein [Acaryochloridaceae cyanobacterium CSU_3_4]|nr:DUF2854 domain-containing protein [Acaryochloridaceae cyanobacterium CSU_3_4]